MKKDWQSSTIYGVAVMVASLAAQMIWGVKVDEETQATVTNNLTSIVAGLGGLIGAATAVIGRAKATGPLNLSAFKILKYLPGVAKAIARAAGRNLVSILLIVTLAAGAAGLSGCVFDIRNVNVSQTLPNGDNYSVTDKSYALNWNLEKINSLLPAVNALAGQDASGASGLLTILNSLANQAAEASETAQEAQEKADAAESQSADAATLAEQAAKAVKTIQEAGAAVSGPATGIE